MATVKRTIALSASAGEIWALIGGFGALDQWVPGVKSCELISEGQDTMRIVTLGDGSTLKEVLEDHSDDERSYSYGIVDGPLPVADYHARLSTEDNEGGCYVYWTASFEPVDLPQDKAEAIVGGIFDAGFDGLKKVFGG